METSNRTWRNALLPLLLLHWSRLIDVSAEVQSRKRQLQNSIVNLDTISLSVDLISVLSLLSTNKVEDFAPQLQDGEIAGFDDGGLKVSSIWMCWVANFLQEYRYAKRDRTTMFPPILRISQKTLLKNLLIPGTHNSGAYSLGDEPADLNVYSPLSDIYDVAMLFAPSISKTVAQNWSTTQNRSAYWQLMDGIRYLDLRVYFDRKDWFLYHYLSGLHLGQILAEVREFLERHVGEIVIIDISSLDVTTTSLVSEIVASLGKLVSVHLGKLLIRKDKHPSPLTSSTYGGFIKSGQRALVLVERQYLVDSVTFFYHSSLIDNWYADTDDLKLLRTGIMQRMHNISLHEDFDGLTKTSWTLTPNQNTIKADTANILDLKPSSLEDYVAHANDELIELLKNASAANKLPGNILVTDFYGSSSPSHPNAVLHLYYGNPLDTLTHQEFTTPPSIPFSYYDVRRKCLA